jgi:cytidine deaminase
MDMSPCCQSASPRFVNFFAFYRQIPMVGCALSKRAKQMARWQAINMTYQKAIDEYLQEQAKPKGKKRGLCPIAAKHGVCFKTLSNLAKGGQTMSAFNASKQKLLCAEEHVLVKFILESANCGIPLSIKSIEKHADAIIAGHNKPGKPVGKTWVEGFLNQHRDQLQTHWSSPLATERAKALNPEAVKNWFELVKEKIVDRGIKKENTYGMDESRFPPSNQGIEHVVGQRGAKIQHKSGNANYENVTALVTICADGTALQPTIIFKGRNFLKTVAKTI